MLNSSPSELFAGIITLLIAFTFHEFAHAWMATQFGDDTPRLYGRLTLNPLSHLDFMGSLMLLFTGFGWAKPVPINPNRIRQHSRAALMFVAISGPLSNLILAVIASIPLRFGWVTNSSPRIDFFPTPYQFLLYFLFTNLGLMLFNLIPLPPLDGEEVLAFFLPPSLERSWNNIRPYGPYILLALLILGPMLGFSLVDLVLGPAIIAIGRFLLGGF
ncbi:MAG TPA: site-2 protease family protein [Pelolinea sp.]|nr:site-2 protease family protein [Pelolinea sp.]